MSDFGRRSAHSGEGGVMSHTLRYTLLILLLLLLASIPLAMHYR